MILRDIRYVEEERDKNKMPISTSVWMTKFKTKLYVFHAWAPLVTYDPYYFPRNSSIYISMNVFYKNRYANLFFVMEKFSWTSPKSASIENKHTIQRPILIAYEKYRWPQGFTTNLTYQKISIVLRHGVDIVNILWWFE